MTPTKAIRAKCLECCCGNVHEVRLCPCSDCPLYPFRFGKNPNIKLTDEQRAKRGAHFKKLSLQHGEQSRNGTGEGKDTTPAPKNCERTAQL